ncbi:MAG TPA: energy transducer TonB [Bradyrhizobium sp.]|nr:energy transducer TonB [Bradyrhizobium sp.]
MTALTLHLPEQNGVSRWLLAGTAIVAAHVAIIASLVLWDQQAPVEPHFIPAIRVSLAPVESTSPETQDQDLPVGPNMQQAEAAPEVPPKPEDKPVETKVDPPAQPQAEVTLPRAEEQKEIQKQRQEATPPAPETRAMPKGERIGQFSEAASNAYLARVAGHLKRFIRYPMEARGASGTVLVRFELNREGAVIGSEVKKSSGNTILDRAALAILQRASPFPSFPAAKPEAQDSYLAPVEFYR